jgi:hypothetical protein
MLPLKSIQTRSKTCGIDWPMRMIPISLHCDLQLKHSATY